MGLVASTMAACSRTSRDPRCQANYLKEESQLAENSHWVVVAWGGVELKLNGTNSGPLSRANREGEASQIPQTNRLSAWGSRIILSVSSGLFEAKLLACRLPEAKLAAETL